jgi:hypothetical protein
MTGFRLSGTLPSANTQRQAFDQGGFADARFTHQDRVVLAASGENIHHLADFVIATEHRVDFPSRARAVTSRVNLSSAFRSASLQPLLPETPKRQVAVLKATGAATCCTSRRSSDCASSTGRNAPAGSGQRQQRPQAIAADLIFQPGHQQVHAADLLFTASEARSQASCISV